MSGPVYRLRGGSGAVRQAVARDDRRHYSEGAGTRAEKAPSVCR